MHIRTTIFTALAAGTLLAVASPLAAAAHISVTPDSADPGSSALVTFTVPNESTTATTTTIELTLPTDTPFASARYVPVPGWTTEVVTQELAEPVTVVGDAEVTEAVTSVTWTADDGNGISAGQLQQFEISLGPVPDTGSIPLALEQTYSDGEVVSWSDVGDDAENPAPVLYINDEAPADDHGSGSDDGSTAELTAAEGTRPSDTGPDVLARVLAVGGLVVGAFGLAFGIAARRRPAR